MKNKVHSLIFKHNNKWYELSLRIDETDVTLTRNVTEQESDLQYRAIFLYPILIPNFDKLYY
jgi:hypothetical protein